MSRKTLIETVPWAIDLQEVTVVRGGRTLLKGVSFRVPVGATAAVVGPNGAGKTTMLRILEGYEFPTSGRATVLGETLGETNLAELRRRVRLIGSAGMGGGGEARDFPGGMDLLTIVATGREGALVHYQALSGAEVREARGALRSVGLLARQGVLWAHASAGERTRALLARARMPAGEGGRLLLLDEPTAGLDPAAREQTVRAMARPGRETTQLIVTHHVEELPTTTTHALVLREGRVLAAGEVGKVLTAGVLSRAFGISIRIRRKKGRFLLSV